MMWVARFCRIPVVINVMHEIRTMASINRKLLIASLARKNILFAGVSNAVRDDMRKSLSFIPKERIVTLYNVMDMDLTEPQLLTKEEARAALHLSKDAFVFACIARLARNKDHKSMIEAFAQIKPHCPQAKLILIGDGELETTLKQQVQACGLTNDIIFTGFVAGAQRYMKAFDCFVLSSIHEAFGRVLIEAMLAKLPIIATRVNGIPEVVSNAGILIEPKDSAALAKNMQHLYGLTQEERASMGQFAYHHVQQHFSIPVFQKHFWQAVHDNAVYSIAQ
jgi:glycosyltransferase involved in cell wall biosynthesis